MQRFTPLLIDAAAPCRHRPRSRWFVDETYLKVGGQWRYLYRAVDQAGQVVDVYLSKKRDAVAARRFFSAAIRVHGEPEEVTTDKSPTLASVMAQLLVGALHDTEQYANNAIESDHGRLKARLGPMRGLKRDQSCRVIVRGHAFIQNLRQGHYELGVTAAPPLRLAAAFGELAGTI